MAAAAQNPHCSTAPEPVPELPAAMPRNRQRAIIRSQAKWVNGTTLRYAFFDADPNPAWAPADDAQKDVVRESFAKWQDLPLGLSFEEVDDLGEAEVRIAFEQGGGSWSYVGRYILQIGADEPTINYGWALDTPYGRTTALHEIGHTLGMPHEHQSPFSGIVWDEQAVLSYFSGPPNNWTEQAIRHNVLDKLDPKQVAGSQWDPDSIMEYEFDAGLIVAPAKYAKGINPPGTISRLDVGWMQSWYPSVAAKPQALAPLQSATVSEGPGEQVSFAISPPASRRYAIATFGYADTVLVLFEDVGGDLRYLAGDDDSGEERNARIEHKLFQGRDYVLRVRVNWAGQSDGVAVMYW
jgi:hypothetical protein